MARRTREDAACLADRTLVDALKREIERASEEVRILRRVSTEVNRTLDADEIFEVVLGTMDDLFGFRHALVFLIDEQAGLLKVAASRGYRDVELGATVPQGVGIVGMVAQRKRMMRIGNLRQRRAYMGTVRREVERAGRGADLQVPVRLPGLPDAESQIAIPLLIKQRLVGVLSVETLEARTFSESDETLVGVVANMAASAIHNAQLYRKEEERREQLEGTVKERTRELAAASQALDLVRELRAKERHQLADLIGDSPIMKETRELLRKVARTASSTVLITGENGTGKDLAAKIVHDLSARASATFMNITCSALAESLLESELFGHERGAFTDAKREKRGLLELSDGGTVFLDEIGEMSLALQAKLLRFLEEKAFKRVGGSRDIRVDVRIVAATNRDVARMVRDGSFREDLYYRLRVLPVELPPLRVRTADIPALVRHFVRKFHAELRKDVSGVSPGAMAQLQAHTWPGNVRELRNAVERAVLLSEGPELRVEDFTALVATGEGVTGSRLPAEGVDFEALERDLVRQAYERAGGNKAKAAKLLGMPRDWLRYRIEKLGLDR